MNLEIENKFAKLFALGIFLVTIAVIAGPVADPVNLPKLLILGVLAFGLTPYLFYTGKKALFETNRIPTLIAIAFLCSAISATLFSKSPLVQNLYGNTGRNTGLITYISFVLVFLVASNFNNIKSIILSLRLLVIAGAINIIYAFIDKFIGDPFPWTNIYGAFLGTFGNPDFAGAFLGLIAGVGLSYLIFNLNSLKLSSFYSCYTFLAWISILFTKTTQGILVGAITSAVVIFYFIKLKLNKPIITVSYLVMVFSMGLIVLMGILQKGPLSSILYKRSVSLRGSYWQAAFNTGNDHPFTGVGLDSFGDWYRRERSLKAATWLPGPETMTNVAHNFFLDFYANGGLPLLASYLILNIFGFLLVYKITKKMKSYEVTPVVLIAIFLGFLAQSIISIPQIGVAIWGWVTIGLMFSYHRITESKLLDGIEKKKSKKGSADSPVGVFVFIGMSVGLLIAVPPFSAEAKYNSAVKSSQLEKIKSSLSPNYFNPPNPDRYIAAIRLMEQSKLYSDSHTYALEAIKFNPDFFNAWQALYFIRNSSSEERTLALKNMKRLDPLNRNLEKLK